MYIPNLKNMTEVKTFNEEYITEEQRIMAQHLLGKGFETHIEGPYDCSYSGKKYCYVWAVKVGSKERIQKIDGRGYNIHI